MAERKALVVGAQALIAEIDDADVLRAPAATIGGGLTVDGQTYSPILRTQALLPGIGPNSVTSGMFVAPYSGGAYSWTDGDTITALTADSGLMSYVCGVDGNVGFYDGGPGDLFAFVRGLSAVTTTTGKFNPVALKLWDSAATASFDVTVALGGTSTDYTLSKGATPVYTVSVSTFNVVSHTFYGNVALSGGATSSGALVANAAFTVNGTENHNGVVTPPAITVSQNNYAPTGLSTCRVLRVSASSAGLSITGLGLTATGRCLKLVNVGSNTISIPHDSTSSTAGNRFYCPGNAAVSLRANGAVELWYDGTSLHWRVMAP